MAGTLYVVATPLGNLADLSLRAAETLKRVAAVAAEDTRHTKILLAHVGSDADLMSFHAHSTDAALRRILHLLGTGKDVALVTDAGTPVVSDPGAELVAAARSRCRACLPTATPFSASCRARAASAAACSRWWRRASGRRCCSRPRRASRTCSPILPPAAGRSAALPSRAS